MCLSAVYWARIDKVYFANSYEDQNIAFGDDYVT